MINIASGLSHQKWLNTLHCGIQHCGLYWYSMNANIYTLCKVYKLHTVNTTNYYCTVYIVCDSEYLSFVLECRRAIAQSDVRSGMLTWAIC